MGDLQLMPENASSLVWGVDILYYVLIALSALFTIPIVLLIVYFGVKYRRGSSADRSPAHTPHWLEWSWIGGLFVLVLPIFLWSTYWYLYMYRVPQDAMEISVVGRQWMWKFQHPTGQREINELHIPVGRPVKLQMTSEDVIHSLYVPAFRTKQDVLPGRYTVMWFDSTKAGTYHLFCAEYCGTHHSTMIGSVIVMEPAAYQAWLNSGGQTATGGGQPALSMAESGRLLFQRNGCASCHISDGSGPGPRLEGVFGAQVQLEDGSVVVADEGYIRESILNPNAKVVRGYEPIMPSFQGQISEEQVMQLIAYLRELGTDGGTGDPPASGGTAGPAAPAPTSVP